MSTHAAPPLEASTRPSGRKRSGQASMNGPNGSAKPRTGRRRKAELEAALRVSEERYRAMVEDSTEIIIRSDADGTLTFVNEAYCRFFGKARGEWIGRSWHLCVDAEDVPLIEAKLATLSPTNPSVVTQSRVRAVHGEVLQVQFVHRGFFDEAGQLTEVQAIGREITECQRTEAELRNREYQLRNVLDSNPAIIFVKDRDSRILLANEAVARFYGTTVDKLTGVLQSELHSSLGMPPDQIATWLDDDREVIDTGRAKEVEECSTWKDGSVRWYHTTKLPIKLLDGRCGVLVVSEDITERKQAAEITQQRVDLQDQLAKIASTVPGIIYSFRLRPDGSACLPFATAHLKDLWGVCPEEVREDFSKAFAHIHEEDIRRVQESVAESARTLKPWREVFRVRHPQEGERWIEGHSMPRREEDGSVLWHGFMHDVTERKAVEERLREREERLRTLGDNIPGGAIYQLLWNEDGQIRFSYVSAGIESIFGMDVQSVLADPKPFWDLIVEEDRPRIKATEFESVRNMTLFDCEFRQRTTKGEIKWIHARSTPHRLADGSVIWDGVAIDITERKRIEDEREIMMHLLRLLNTSSDLRVLAQEVTSLVREWFDFEAVGIRLQQGDDYPYFETHGFPGDFIELENHLCQRDANGEVLRDLEGQPVLECMCGNVLCKRFDPSKPFFTQRGSFWANDTTRLLATTTPADRQANTRNRWNGEGYESVALVALRVGETTFGLLQVNDRRKNRFTPEIIALLERIADSLAIAFAHRLSAQKLGESEQQFRAMFEVASIGIAQANVRTGRWLRVNQKMCEITGYSEAEMLRMHVPEVTHPEDRDKDWDLFQKVVSGEVPDYRSEKRYLRKDGRIAWVNVNMTVIRNAAGEAIRTMAAIEDITERKRAEEDLRLSHERLQKVLEVETVGVMFWDLTTGHLVDANHAFLDLMGYSREDVEERRLTWQTLTPPEYIAASEAEVRKFRETGRVGPYEKECFRKDGTRRWLVFAGSSLGDNACVEFCVDISDRKRAEQALADEAVRHRILVEQSSDGIVVINEHGAVCEANHRYAEMLGYTPDEILRLHVWDWDTQWDRAQLLEMIRNVDEAGSRFETRHRRKDGSFYDVEISNNGVTIAERKLVFCVCRDISQRKKAEEQLRKLSRAVEQSPASIVITDLQGRIEYVNPKFVEITGYSFEEARGQNPRILKSGELSSEVYEELWRTITSGGEWRGELHNRRKDGTYFWEYAVISSVKDDAGHITHFLAVKEDVSARKQAEKALRTSEDLLRQMGRLAKAGGWELDVATGEGQWTEEIARIHDLDLGARSTRELFTTCYRGESRERIALAVENAISQGVAYDLELEFVSTKGVRKWVHTIGEPVLESGRVIKLRGTLQDITERKQAEAALRSSQELYHSLVEQLGQPLFRLDRDGRITFANSSYCASMKRSLSELMGKSDFDLFPPDLAANYWADSRYVLETGQTFESLERHLGPEGQESFVHVAKMPLRDSHGNIVGLQCLFWDVTSQHLAERALRESEKRFLTAFQSSPATAVITSLATQQIREVNAAFCQLSGYSREELLGQTCLGCGLWAYPSERAEMMRLLEEKGSVRAFEIVLRTRFGELRTLLYSTEPLQLAGEPCLIASGVDITERKQAEEALRRMNTELEERVAARTEELRQAKEKADAANRAKSIFLANMSHEIRTPMNAVLGFTQLLLNDASTKPSQRDYLTRILRSGEHLLNIINEILEMARIESGQITFNPVAFDVPGMLHELESMFSLRAEAQQVSFAVEVAAGMPRFLLVDPTKLNQIFINLLSNAFKFTPPGGRIALRLQAAPESPGQIRLKAEVEDSGPGIHPDDAARVFEPFFQTLSGRAAGGTGLGLSISRGFARMMGGDLTVLSEVGAGSRFQFELLLPLAEPGELPHNGPRPQNVRLTAESAGYRVLAVDDAPDNCEVLTRFLKSLDFNVQSAANGLEALWCCQHWSPGLVILDLRMPVMDGYEACRQLKATPGPEPKILILSASVAEDAKQQAMAAGADAFMRKPFQFDELLACIQELTGVEYLRNEPEPSTPLFPATREAKESIAAHGLPEELLSALRKALTAADYDKMMALLNQAGLLDEALNRGLRELIESYDYTALDALLNPDNSTSH